MATKKTVGRGTRARVVRIRRAPDVAGGAACIRDTQVPVWLLVDYRRRGLADRALLDAFAELTAGDLEAAWTYAAEHAEEIESSIREKDTSAETAYLLRHPANASRLIAAMRDLGAGRGQEHGLIDEAGVL